MSDELDKLFELQRGMYFRRDGTPYQSMEEWCADFEKGMDLRRVDETYLWWGGQVSTVWLGLNHNYLGGKPLIFETMVFPPRGLDDLDMERYSTEAQALAGHKAMVKRWMFTPKIIGIWFWVIQRTVDEWIKRR